MSAITARTAAGRSRESLRAPRTLAALMARLPALPVPAPEAAAILRLMR